MKDEIKEILENIKCPQLGYDEYGKWGALPINVRMTLKRLCDYVVSCDDYITNLQQENERLKQDYINLRNYIKMRNVSTEVEDKALLYNIELENINKKKYLDYKSRCEKAIEYNKEIVNNYLEEDNCEYCDGRYATAKHNLNILQNEIKGGK